MKFKCVYCHEEHTEDDDYLIKLHEKIDHYGHLSCLGDHYKYFRNRICLLCRESIDGVTAKIGDYTSSLNTASVLGRLDIFEKRLSQLANGDYRYKPWCSRFFKYVTKCHKVVKPSDEYMTSFDYQSELTNGIISTVRNRQAEYLQLLLNYISNMNIPCKLLYCYEYALENDDKTYARMILEMVLNNQAAFAENMLYKFLSAAVASNDMESASSILQNGIGVEFRKDVILNLEDVLRFVNSDTNSNVVDIIDQWPLDELDYGLRYAARDGHLKSCKFLISKGASIKRAGVNTANWRYFI